MPELRTASVLIVAQCWLFLSPERIAKLGQPSKVPKSQLMVKVVIRLESHLLAALRRAFALTAGELPMSHMIVDCVEIKLRTIKTVPGLPYILYLTRDEHSAITFCLYAASDHLREDDFIALDALFEHADYVLE